MKSLSTIIKSLVFVFLSTVMTTSAAASSAIDSSSIIVPSILKSDVLGWSLLNLVTSNTFEETFCSKSFSDDVIVKTLSDRGYEVGNTIWMSRKAKRLKAKYFAYKQYGKSVIDRYNTWRKGRSIVAITSGAYGTGFNDITDIPVGLTIDNGIMVNKNLDLSKDALVIVEAVGGIRMTNIEDGRLTIQDNGSKVLDLNNSFHRGQFISWAKKKEATVFQTHLLIQNNTLKVHYNSSKSRALRKVLVLCKSSSGEIFHVIYNLQEASYTLQEVAQKILLHQTSLGMKVIMAANLDTGSSNVISTGGAAKDCNGQYLEGPSKRSNLTNALVYYHEQ